MKIELLIAQFLYQHKRVTLPTIGTFTLSMDITINPEDDKGMVLPENAIQFEYNPYAPQDNLLVEFIMKQTRKIKPLAESDLESFCILGRQFLNIGKPLELNGIGLLQITQAGIYEFIQGDSTTNRFEDSPKNIKEKSNENEKINFSTPPRVISNKKWMLPFSIITLFVIAFVYFYFGYNQNKNKEQEIISTPIDTVNQKTDTLSAATISLKDSLTTKDSAGFKIVIKQFNNKSSAEKSFSKYTDSGYTCILYTKDSITYKLAIPVKGNLKDSSRIKDSVEVIFGKKIFIDLN